ncbi:Gnt-II system L-idonate transporter [Frondihabitans sp. 762G35]|uniref:GntP family permease n=1 Tax=Frondihabitans sp. 762G35 TaxID=1446794 RepID=UPI000D214665|nr:gluconate:H+ symporter [Frondihabitans sp. 762G35]ARC55664.1 Gnt-II system L-idonate transporter [Frondihabitans sp. 762G35]
MHFSPSTPSLATAAVQPSGGDAQLIIAALAGIAVIIVLITWLKVHPFLALTIGSLGVGIGAGLAPGDAVTSFGAGFGATMTSVGILVGLGAMFGKLLVDSGGADRIVDNLVARSSPRSLPWTMALIGALIGLPMFFEVGVVLLVPVVILVARRTKTPIMRIAIPALAGLSVMHGLVPPHPGPLVAVTTLGANLGLTIALGVALAIPTVIIAGPLFGRIAARWVPIPAPALFDAPRDDSSQALTGSAAVAAPGRRPSFAVAVAGVLLPVALMLLRAVWDAVEPEATGGIKGFFDFLGTPMIALGIAVVYGMVFFARSAGMSRDDVQSSVSSALPAIAGILLIVGAGGGFKQVLIDTGIGTLIANAISDSGVSVILVAWFVAALVRVATGSATVATVTAAGILAPVTAHLASGEVSLVVLAIGAGSLFLSHVNDAGFWLIKEYLGLSVGQTLKSWTVMECLISVVGLAGALLLGLVI